MSNASPYSVAPFGGPNYSKNSDRCIGDQTPCVICGKAVDGDAGVVFVEVVNKSGERNRFAFTDEVVAETDSFGFFPVGSGCHRRFRVKA